MLIGKSMCRGIFCRDAEYELYKIMARHQLQTSHSVESLLGEVAPEVYMAFAGILIDELQFIRAERLIFQGIQ